MIASAGRALAPAPRWAARGGLALVAFALGAHFAADWSIPRLIASAPGIALGAAEALLLVASAAAALLDRSGPTPLRAARALVRLGLALLLAGVPGSLFGRTERTFTVGEGEELGPDALPGAGGLRFGEVSLAPRGEGPLLSKTVSIAARREGGEPFRIGLWPPTIVGPWRLTVLRFGYAPPLSWTDEAGRALADGYAMLGTFPTTEEDARLVEWTPAPNLMMGVGYFPPALEDLLTPPRSDLHLFLRAEEATIGGARRDLRDPEAHRWLLDGRLEAPVWFVQVFRGKEKRWEGRLRAGEEARFPGGGVRIGSNTALWVEIQAVRDAWLWALVAGAAAIGAGAALWVAGWVGRRVASLQRSGSRSVPS
jgi:hypothetical protein